MNGAGLVRAVFVVVLALYPLFVYLGIRQLGTGFFAILLLALLLLRFGLIRPGERKFMLPLLLGLAAYAAVTAATGSQSLLLAYPVLVNLASNEYWKSLVPGKIEGDIVTPVFKEKKGNDYRVIAIHAKLARGLMSRFIIENRIDAPQGLKDFRLDGYRYNSKLSNNKQWVFSRG